MAKIKADEKEEKKPGDNEDQPPQAAGKKRRIGVEVENIDAPKNRRNLDEDLAKMRRDDKFKVAYEKDEAKQPG